MNSRGRPWTGATRMPCISILHAFWMKLTELAAQGRHMIRVGTMFVIPSDRCDTSTYSQAGRHICVLLRELPGRLRGRSEAVRCVAQGLGQGCRNRPELSLSFGLSELHRTGQILGHQQREHRQDEGIRTGQGTPGCVQQRPGQAVPRRPDGADIDLRHYRDLASTTGWTAPPPASAIARNARGSATCLTPRNPDRVPCRRISME